MTVIEMVNAITRRKSERSTAHAKSLRQLVLALADNKKISPEEAEAILDQAGWTTGQLKAAVETEQERRRLKIVIAEEPEVRKQIDETERQRLAAIEEFTRAKATCLAKEQHAAEAMDLLQAQLAAIDTAKVRLRDTASAEAKQLAAAMGNDMIKLARRRTYLQEELNVLQHGVHRTHPSSGAVSLAEPIVMRLKQAEMILSREINRVTHGRLGPLTASEEARVANYREKVNGLRNNVDGYRAELIEVDARIAAMNAEKKGDHALLTA